MTASYHIVHDSAEIDLTRHALIEASAGTGKTYTLENLVVRLLTERQDIALENILMVTFTEKATSELKNRIQEKLEQALDTAGKEGGDTAIVQKIRETLDAFDTASIYTIHGFCHTVLRDFAFENGSLLQTEVIDDAPIYDTLIREQMRKVWPEVHGDRLPEILQVSGFIEGKDRFLSSVVNIARRVYRPEVGDEIKPDPGCRSFEEIRSEIIAMVLELKTLIGDPPTFSDGFGRLNIHGSSKKSLMDKMVVPLEEYLSAVDVRQFYVKDLLALIGQIQGVTSSGRQGIECLIPAKWLKSGANPEVCPNLEAIHGRLVPLAENLVSLVYFLAVNAIRQLQADAARFKRQQGWISYDDMLTNVDAALSDKRSTALIQTLRTKYSVAFVDEFQDTDPVQWRIFKRLFLRHVKEPAGNLLFLIGDPKQAIYSFRGADVHTYLNARNEMERLVGSGKANLYSLATNWRSKPALVGVFNDLFCGNEWFPPHDQAGTFEIGYQEAGSPKEDELPFSVAADDSHRPVLNVVDLRGSKSPKFAKPVLAGFIAAEIRYLIDSGGIEIQTKNHVSRPLDFGDICILVRGKPDAVFLEPELLERGIPYAYYKKPGLFLSDEALYLSLVCHAVIDPGRIPDVKKALLTPFFGFASADLYAVENLPVSHPLIELLYKWHDLARLRQWGRLFQSLLEDSGLLFRESATADWDRKYTNYRQIFEHLEAVAYGKNLDFVGLSALLDSYRKQTVGVQDDADIHQIETEARKVQILTMHVSKGLQFPVVFIAGGLTQPFVDDYHVYHFWDKTDPDGDSRKIVDLSRSCDKRQHEREKNDEDKRLYYVALTRAQFKLYIPFFPATGRQSWLEPVCRFLSSAVSSAFSPEDGHLNVCWLTPDIHDHSLAGGAVTGGPPSMTGDGPESRRPLLPANKDYRHRKSVIASFSSLHGKMLQGAEPPAGTTGFQAVHGKNKGDDEPFAALAPPVRSPGAADDLPGGVDVGSMFHDILEHIDFALVAANPDNFADHRESMDLIVKTMEMYRVDAQWRSEVCRMIAHTLTTPVMVGGEPLILGNLKTEDRVHEVEFYYPLSLPADHAASIPDCEVKTGRNGFIRGFVDLVFRHKEKYYIADWKTNRIDAGYDTENLELSMAAAGYHLQYKLYTIAVLRWLKQAFGDRFDRKRQFGGVYYFYLRGMGQGDGSGIFTAATGDLGRLERLEKEIGEMLRA